MGKNEKLKDFFHLFLALGVFESNHQLQMKSFLLFTLLVCAMVIPGRLWGQALKDTIIMNDGTIISGDLKTLKSGKVEFDIDNIGLVKIKFDRIRMIKGLTHTYRIETSDRKIYYGQIRRSDKPGMIKIDMGDSSAVVPLNHVSFITSLNNNTNRIISGYVSSGFNYARSSNSGRFNFDGMMRFQSRRNTTEVMASMFLSQTDTNWIRDRESLSISSYYVINPWFSIGGNLKYQRNFELGLARRFQEGIGLTAMLLNKNNFQIRTLTGIVVNQEKNTEGFELPTQVEIPMNLYVEFFRFSNPNISVSTNQTAYFSITDPGRVRWDADSRLTWEIISDLSLSLQFYHNFDNRPPSVNSRKWDYGIVTGLKYTF